MRRKKKGSVTEALTSGNEPAEFMNRPSSSRGAGPRSSPKGEAAAGETSASAKIARTRLRELRVCAMARHRILGLRWSKRKGVREKSQHSCCERRIFPVEAPFLRPRERLDLCSAVPSPIRLTGPWTEFRVQEFLAETRIPMRLAANTDSGFPIVLSLWFLAEDEEILAVVHRDARIAKRLEGGCPMRLRDRAGTRAPVPRGARTSHRQPGLPTEPLRFSSVSSTGTSARPTPASQTVPARARRRGSSSSASGPTGWPPGTTVGRMEDALERSKPASKVTKALWSTRRVGEYRRLMPQPRVTSEE